MRGCVCAYAGPCCTGSNTCASSHLLHVQYQPSAHLSADHSAAAGEGLSFPTEGGNKVEAGQDRMITRCLVWSARACFIFLLKPRPCRLFACFIFMLKPQPCRLFVAFRTVASVRPSSGTAARGSGTMSPTSPSPPPPPATCPLAQPSPAAPAHLTAPLSPSLTPPHQRRCLLPVRPGNCLGLVASTAKARHEEVPWGARTRPPR